MLLERWLPERGLERVLKTDVFDELAGEGLYPLLRERARHVIAIDVSAAATAAARERHPGLETVVADALRLPFADDHFDAVVSNSTLDHLSDRAEVATAIAELGRVLQPGGLLVITLDNRLNPLIALRNVLPRGVARRLRRVPYDAGWTCGPRTLRRMLAAADLEVLELTAVLHVPRALVTLLGRPSGDSARLRALRAGERLERWPTRFLSGHYVAALATPAPGRSTGG
jgi:SAM-dependent methyltransferase